MTAVSDFSWKSEPLAWAAGTFVLRLGEYVLLAIPDLVLGVLVAMLLRHGIGDARVRSLTRNPFAAAACAVALPVGAVGVLPVAVMLRRAGASAGSVAAFLVVGGAATPASLAYLPDRVGIGGAVLLVTLLYATALAAAVSLGRDRDVSPVEGDDAPELPAAARTAGRLARGVSLAAVIAVVAAAGVAALLRPSYIGEALVEQGAAPALAAAVLPHVLLYMPEEAAVFAGEARHGLRSGGVWPLTLGTGLTVGTWVVAVTLLGVRRTLVLLLVVGGMTAAGFAASELATRMGIPLDEDSHAFDGLSQPYHVLDHPNGIAAGVVGQWRPLVPPAAASAAVFVLVLIVARVNLRVRPREVARQHVGRGVLLAAAATAAVTWCLFATATYFLSPRDALEQLRHVEGDLSQAVAVGDAHLTSHALARVTHLARRGSVGSMLRLDTQAAERLRTIADEAAHLEGDETVTYADLSPLFRSTSDARSG